MAPYYSFTDPNTPATSARTKESESIIAFYTTRDTCYKLYNRLNQLATILEAQQAKAFDMTETPQLLSYLKRVQEKLEAAYTECSTKISREQNREPHDTQPLPKIWLKNIQDSLYQPPSIIARRLQDVHESKYKFPTMPTLEQNGAKPRYEYLYEHLMVLNNRFNALLESTVLSAYDLHLLPDNQTMHEHNTVSPSAR